jgi:hypothetical protein
MATSAKTPDNDFALWEQRISGAADGSYPGVVFTADETEAINKLKALRAGATPKEWEEFDRFMKEVWGRKSKTAGRRRKTRKHTHRVRKTRRRHR